MAKKKIGTIVNFFGLNGQLKVSLTTSTPELRFKEGKKVLIADEYGEEKEYVVSSFRLKNERIAVISLEGYDDINDIQSFIGKDIYQNIRATKDTYFYDELVGMKVLTSDQKEIGEVDKVVQMPAGEYLVVKEKIYIPFKISLFIETVDKVKRIITLTPLGDEAIQ